jgi:hypothetical protein
LLAIIMQAVLVQLLRILREATKEAIRSSPVLVFESLLLFIAALLFLWLGLNHRLRMRRLESADRQHLLEVLAKLHLPPDDRGLKELGLLDWLRKGGRGWKR